ncbi:MAG: hypothetical protein AAF921_08875 [Cyanobacteria bacterium P01_D01_bin.44]
MPDSGSLDFRLVTRICHLQQALDQALWSLEDLSKKADAREFLEIQLAETEKYANVQHRLIHELQQKLTCAQQQYNQEMQSVSGRVGALLLHQQMELDRLQRRLQQGHTEIQSYLSHLTTRHRTPSTNPEDERLALQAEVQIARMLTVSLNAQLNAAREHAQAISAMLSQSQNNLKPAATKAAVSIFPLIEAHNGPLDNGHLDNGHLDKEHLGNGDRPMLPTKFAAQPASDSQQARIQALELELAEQFKHQTHLQSRCQRLAAERDFYRDQLTNLQAQPSQGHSANPPIPTWGQRAGRGNG